MAASTDSPLGELLASFANVEHSVASVLHAAEEAEKKRASAERAAATATDTQISTQAQLDALRAHEATFASSVSQNVKVGMM